jgi:AcrR family transcriptional regulator
MGKSRDNETRQRIVQAAKVLFVKQGHDGVNMRELAEKAGVNKGLLHYYFKSKESIFTEVFQGQAGRLYTEVLDIVEGDAPFERKVERMVERYFSVLAETPSLPAFIMFEVQRDPGMVARSPFRDTILRIAVLIEPELKKRKLPKQRRSGVHFLVDVLSLCAFTFAMLPGIAKVMGFNTAQRAAFLRERQAHINSVLQQSLKP